MTFEIGKPLVECTCGQIGKHNIEYHDVLRREQELGRMRDEQALKMFCIQQAIEFASPILETTSDELIEISEKIRRYINGDK